MKDFRTELKITRSRWEIGLKSGLLTIGSCFSDAIGSRLKSNKLMVLNSPFATVYNPLSIHKLLSLTAGAIIDDDSFFETDDMALNYDFHSSFVAVSKPELHKRIESIVVTSQNFLRSCDYVFITYGTAWVYHRIDTDRVVANCHKQPASLFKKNLLTQSEIVESFSELHEVLKKFNSKLRFIITVSPVRHLKDSLELNSVSKSILRASCHEIQNNFESVEYFPAFEIMMDDLRDYRFYASDMIHPTPDAEEYIWQKFGQCYFTDELKIFIEKWRSVKAAITHRPFNVDSPAHQEFLKRTLQRLRELENSIDVSEEIQFVAKQIR